MDHGANNQLQTVVYDTTNDFTPHPLLYLWLQKEKIFMPETSIQRKEDTNKSSREKEKDDLGIHIQRQAKWTPNEEEKLQNLHVKMA